MSRGTGQADANSRTASIVSKNKPLIAYFVRKNYFERAVFMNSSGTPIFSRFPNKYYVRYSSIVLASFHERMSLKQTIKINELDYILRNCY